MLQSALKGNTSCVELDVELNLMHLIMDCLMLGHYYTSESTTTKIKHLDSKQNLLQGQIKDKFAGVDAFAKGVLQSFLTQKLLPHLQQLREESRRNLADDSRILAQISQSVGKSNLQLLHPYLPQCNAAKELRYPKINDGASSERALDMNANVDEMIDEDMDVDENQPEPEQQQEQGGGLFASIKSFIWG